MTLLKRIEARLANPELNANFNRSVSNEREQLRKIIDNLTEIYEADNELHSVKTHRYVAERNGDYGEAFYSITVIYD